MRRLLCRSNCLTSDILQGVNRLDLREGKCVSKMYFNMFSLPDYILGQGSVSDASPVQLSPPPNGAGSLQTLVLVLVVAGATQDDQLLQAPQEPSITKN